MRASIGNAGSPEDLLDVRVLPERVHQGIEFGAIDGGGEQRRRDLEILIAEGGDVEFAQGVVGLLQHLLEPGQYLLLVSAADESGHGFDNVNLGDLSATLLNRYISAAQ